MKRSELKRRVSLQARNGIKPVTRSKPKSERVAATVDRDPVTAACFLALHGVHESGWMPACNGWLIRAHLLPKQLLKHCTTDVWDERSWVWCCGGPTGIGGHHGMFDTSRTLRLPRAAIPEATEQLAAELGLDWYLDREYGTPDTEAEAA